MSAQTQQIRWMYRPREINLRRGIEYGLTDLMGGGWNNIVSGVIFTFLMTQGVNPAAAGGVTAIGRIFDAVFSLFFGSITDNFFRTRLGRRFGRRHFFIFAGLVAFAISFPLFWLPASKIFPGNEFWFYVVIYVTVELAIAMILIPWEALPTEMTNDYTKRTVLSGSRMFISATGTAIVFFVLALLKHYKNPNAYLVTGIIWTIIFVIAIFISWRCTWEAEPTPELLAALAAKPKRSLLQSMGDAARDYVSIFRNKAFRQHLLIYLLSFTGKDLYAIVLPTFVIYVMGMGEDVPWMLQALSVFGILSTLIAAKLMITRGPRFLYTLSYSSIIVAIVAYTSCYFLHLTDPITIFVVVSIVYQLGRGILEFTPWNVFPFIPDVDRLMTRQARAGIYAAAITFFRKSTGALAAWIVGLLFTWIGFNPSIKHLDEAVKTGVTLVFCLGVLLLLIPALILAQFFKLNRQTHDVLKHELIRLDEGGAKSEVSPQAREVAEELTGHPYETLWPDNVVEAVKYPVPSQQ